MVGTMPVLLAVGAMLFAHERLHALGWIALAVSTTGAALIALSGQHTAMSHGPTIAGDLLVVFSLFIALFWVLLNKKLMQRHSHVVVTAYGLLAGTLMLAVWIPLTQGLPPVHGVSLKAWAALAACSAPPPPPCCGTGASPRVPHRRPACSSTWSPSSARCSASFCCTKSSARSPGWAAR